MYVGAWQEFKLMKVIEDLRDENERLKYTIEHAAAAAASPVAPHDGAMPLDTNGFASSVPSRSPPLVHASPRRPSTEGGVGGPFDRYPPGHPLSTSYRACYPQQQLPVPSLTQEEEATQQQQQRRVHHRASGTARSASGASDSDGAPARLPFRMYWRPDAYGRYSIDNHEASVAQQQRQLATSSGAGPSHQAHTSGRACVCCERKREAAEMEKRARTTGSSPTTTSTTAPNATNTAAVLQASRQRDPSAWATVSSAGAAEREARATPSALNSLPPPTYGPNEAAILAQLGLTAPTTAASASAQLQQRRVAGTPGRLAEHPLVHDLARRVPLDTKSLGQLAGQKVYERRIKGDTTDTPAVGARRQAESLPREPRPAQEKESLRQVERRLRLQALYSGMTPEAVEDYVRQMTQGQQPVHDDAETTRSGSGEEEEGDAMMKASASASHPLGRGVPWDALPNPSDATRATILTPTNHGGQSTQRLVVPPGPAPTTVSTLDDIFGGGGDFTNNHMRPPPAPQDIAEGDIGGLLEWAENLDLDLIDAM